MKKSLHFLGILTLLVAMSFGSVSATVKTLMFISNGGAAIKTIDGADIRDSIAVAKLRAYGYNVVVISSFETKDATQKALDAINNCDAIIISSTGASGDDLAKGATIASGKPILSWEYGVWDEMKMCGNGSSGWKDSLVYLNLLEADPQIVGISETIRFIESSLTPDVTVRGLATPYAPGAVEMAKVSAADTFKVVALYAETGAELLDGVIAPAMYIAWGLFDSGSLATVKNDGWILFYRAVAALVGENYVPITSSRLNLESKSRIWYSNKSLNLNLDGSSKKTDIKIFDVTGRLMMQKQVLGGTNVTIQMNNFKSGLYIVKGDNFARKFIVE